VGFSIRLVSDDGAVAKLCREVLSELFGTESTLITGAAGSVTPEHDLCIWDFTPGETAAPLDAVAASRSNLSFLVRPEDLLPLQVWVGRRDINVLLKPLSRAALRALLLGANPHQQEQNEDYSGFLNTLRREREELLQCLIQANFRLQESDQEHSNFLAKSVHDLRAPLTAISGYCGLLLAEELGPLTSEQRRVLKRMMFSATRLARITSGIFQLSVSHNLESPLTLEKADLRDCLDQALDEVALMLEDKRISVAAEINAVPKSLLFDKAQIVEAIVNLLDNACKFAPRDGVIEIRGYPFFWERRTGRAASLDHTVERRVNHERAPNSFRVDIRDTGPGISPAQVDKIFGEYSPYGGAQDRSGGGLGLAICRMILRRHNGRIWAESSPAGALFCFVLPQQCASGHASQGEINSEAQSGRGSGGANACR